MKLPGLTLAFTLALLTPADLFAGQIYGTITSGGTALKNAAVEIQCGKDGAPLTGTTDADGAYRINVPQQGQCTLALPSYEGRPAATVFSTPNPARYSFELVKLGNGKFELQRR